MSTHFVIGQKVAIYRSHYGHRNVTTVTVERDTKLYWVAGGRKFRKADGVEPGRADNWGPTTYLLPLSDQRVVGALVAARKSAAYGQVLNAQEALRKDRENLDLVQALRQALAKYSDTLKAIADTK